MNVNGSGTHIDPVMVWAFVPCLSRFVEIVEPWSSLFPIKNTQVSGTSFPGKTCVSE